MRVLACRVHLGSYEKCGLSKAAAHPDRAGRGAGDRRARVRILLAHQTPQIGDRLAHPGRPLYVTPAYEISLLRPDQFSRLTTADASRPQPTPLAVAPESMTNDRSGRPDVGDKAVNLAS